MGLVDHVEWLIEKRDSELVGTDGSSIGKINASLEALLRSSASESGIVDRVQAAEGVEYSTSPSIWDDIRAATQNSFAAHIETAENAQAPSNAMNRITSRLLARIEAISNHDEAIRKSILSDILRCLQPNATTDDRISATLAETLGFDHLDLAVDIISNRDQVLKRLALAEAFRIQETNGVAGKEHEYPQNDISNGATVAEGSHQSANANSKPYIPGSSMVIQKQEQIMEQKRSRAEQRRLERAKAQYQSNGQGDTSALPYTAKEMAMMRAQSLQAATNRPLFGNQQAGVADEPVYPHVYASQGGGGSVLSAFGAKFSLPVGTSRSDHSFYEEVTIPPPRQLPMRLQERLIPINEMDSLSKGAFPGYSCLNRLQSAVYPLGYGSNENLLICAPTGAGKTDVAMLTVLRTIKQHAKDLEEAAVIGGSSSSNTFGIRYDDFKIIYVAPMKALASEIVVKFSKRLRYLGVKVRELTGDMQMTRQEIADTQMIVTTPEKWDVVTRKPTGEGELATKIRLLIIDEVHLLHEDRGAVIETIVARTLRLVESSQSLIRIVGLSATLPNYVDVADFLRVNRYKGLFFFDSSFRPVPLEQHFLGVQGKVNSAQSRLNHDKATFEKLSTLIQQGHQMMIFVHARKETVKTATTMREMCKEEGLLEHLGKAREDGSIAGKVNQFRRDIMESRNRELKELFETGFGIHHAGMLRKDRNLSERLFESGVTRVLCCTSTLAWGVNLPAYAVLIKGTDVYDSALGRFSDLSILDVLQIFGRAGRPQYESVGVGYIITTQEKLSHYVDAIASQHPIESKFKIGLIDALNAEVALGSVSNVTDGVTWLSYTYLFTRMKRNPLAYGMVADELAEDPQLGARRLLEITTAAKYLSTCKMMQFDATTGQFTITELGRIAAKYYISYRTIEVFNEKLKNEMSEADILAVFAQGADFEQVIPRDSEVQELKALESKVPCQIIGACETSSGKTNLLLQAYVSRLYIEDFALVSDSGYISQNAGRIMRALLEISLNNKWASTSRALIGLTKSIDKRLWAFDHPLEHVQSGLKPDLVYQIKRWADEIDVKSLAQMDKEEIASICKVNPRHAEAIRDAARSFPYLGVKYKLRPVRHDLVSVQVTIQADFIWKEEKSSTIEPFFVWIENEEEVDILQWKRIVIRPQSITVDVTFLVDVLSTVASGLWIHWASDRWLGSEDQIHVPFDQLVMPPIPQESTCLFDLPLLKTYDCLQVLDEIPRVSYQHHINTFNSLQTQLFHSCLHSQGNLLVCMPRRSGKTTMTQLAIWNTLYKRHEQKEFNLILALYPNASLAQHAYLAFRRSANQPGVNIRLGKKLADVTFAAQESASRVLFTTASLILEFLFGNSNQDLLASLSLIVVEDIDCFSGTYELAIAYLLRHTIDSTTRWIITSTSLLYTEGVQNWLQIKDNNVFNFSPRNRPCALKTEIKTFDLPHSMNLVKVMIKPAYDCIKQQGLKTNALIFVPSRNQCFTTAKDLTTQAASELDTEAFLGVHPNAIEPFLCEISDQALHEPLCSGIGIIYEGIKPQDRALILSLYQSEAIHLLVASRDSIWSLDVRCKVVIMMSLQFFRSESSGSLQDVLSLSEKGAKHARHPFHAKLVDYPLNEVIRMQSFAAEPTSNNEYTHGECLIMCQEEQVGYLQRVLHTGYALESTLLDEEKDRLVLLFAVLSDIAHKRSNRVEDILEQLNWTLARMQMTINPSYYGAKGSSDEDASEVLSGIADEMMQQLTAMRCIAQEGNQKSFGMTKIGLLAVTKKRLLQSLYTLSKEYLKSSDRVAKVLLSIPTMKTTDGHDDMLLSNKAVRLVLDATRSCLSSEVLTRFEVPKLIKKKEGEMEKEVEQPFKAVHLNRLLLAVFLTEKAEVLTADEVNKIRSSRKKSVALIEVDQGITVQDQIVAKGLLEKKTIRMVETILVE